MSEPTPEELATHLEEIAAAVHKGLIASLSLDTAKLRRAASLLRPPEDGERADLANWLQGHSGGGSFEGEDEYRKLKRCVALLRQIPPPPAAGVSREVTSAVRALRGRLAFLLEGLDHPDTLRKVMAECDSAEAAIEAIPEAEPSRVTEKP